jgi:hypothetical protein
MAAFFTVGLEASAAMRSSGGEQKAARIRCFALNQRHREFESSSLRQPVTGLRHSPGMRAKKPACRGDAPLTPGLFSSTDREGRAPNAIDASRRRDLRIRIEMKRTAAFYESRNCERQEHQG